jgi:glyoxylate utilization-related uncharacterized protein
VALSMASVPIVAAVVCASAAAAAAAACVCWPCRFVFVVEGNVTVKHEGKALTLGANDYMYFPPGSKDT